MDFCMSPQQKTGIEEVTFQVLLASVYLDPLCYSSVLVLSSEEIV